MGPTQMLELRLPLKLVLELVLELVVGLPEGIVKSKYFQPGRCRQFPEEAWMMSICSEIGELLVLTAAHTLLPLKPRPPHWAYAGFPSGCALPPARESVAGRLLGRHLVQSVRVHTSDSEGILTGCNTGCLPASCKRSLQGTL